MLVIGGSVSAGMAIFDTMQYIPCDVRLYEHLFIVCNILMLL